MTTDTISPTRCDRSPRHYVKPHEKAADTIAECEFLLSFGTPWVAICRQLDRSPAALYRYLYRWGRPDLAASLGRVFDHFHSHPRGGRAA